MSKITTLLLFLIFSTQLKAQVFWTETFNNSCTAGCDVSFYAGTNGAWTDNTSLGANAAQANRWYVSCAENGHTAGVCGTGCKPASATATLASLHIGAHDGFVLDAGASYDAGGLCGLGICVKTDKRAESPTINCTGLTGITLAFDYIENGQAGSDYATVWYYDGTTWTQIATPAQTVVCGSGQGQWTAYSIALPASANNNANVKIGFRWVNNDDGLGTDPSVAIDNVTLSAAKGLPINLIDFTGNCVDNTVTLNWSTASETNNNYFSIERTTDGATWQLAGKIRGAGNITEIKNYTFTEINPASNAPLYYRLSQTDFDGDSRSFNEINITCTGTDEKNISIYPNPTSGSFNLEFANGMEKTVQNINVYTVLGQIIFHQAVADKNIQELQTIDLSTYSQGIYFLEIRTLSGIITKKIIIN
ncbi:MAG: T9SS type A sorting domain-containing protein [Bacteroidia bacterium]